MTKHNIIAIAASLLAAAGISTAQETGVTTNEPLLPSQSRGLEFIPMTRSERVREYVKGTFWPGSLVSATARAGIDQALDRPKEWDSTGEGFAKRLGNVYAKHLIRQTVQFGASTALHEDDRYLASGQKGFWTRAKYAVSSAFLARRDNGDRCFALARMSGSASAALLSRTWQPASTSGMGSAASTFGFTIAGDVGTNFIEEFWPDLKNRFRRN
jgi:hypothetical protein